MNQRIPFDRQAAYRLFGPNDKLRGLSLIGSGVDAYRCVFLSLGRLPMPADFPC